MSGNGRFPYVGQTPFFLCRQDQRFAYCLYVPPDYYRGSGEDYTLAVLVHGSRRSAETYRDKFMDFAAAQRAIVLAPLFPLGVFESPGSENEDHNYKFVKYHDVRYDLILGSMIDEVTGQFTRLRQKYLLFGFSGGGQFAHRYFYLHPRRLLAVSIGAPGTITLLDATRPWWRGVKDLDEHFGVRLDLQAMRTVKVQMIIGEQDTERWDLDVEPGSPFWMAGENDTGKDRLERMVSLRSSFEKHGIAVEHTIVPNLGHDGYGILGEVKRFFAASLQSQQAGR